MTASTGRKRTLGARSPLIATIASTTGSAIAASTSATAAADTGSTAAGHRGLNSRWRWAISDPVPALKPSENQPQATRPVNRNAG
jgi:hypothetical protein